MRSCTSRICRASNVQRLTNNEYYEAEVTVSPDGKWIVFGRMIDGNMDLWVMKSDGTNEKQITFTEDDQEGAPVLPAGQRNDPVPRVEGLGVRPEARRR